MASSVTLANLGDQNVPVQWHEAVAIVRQLCDVVGQSGCNVPEPDGVEIRGTGELRVRSAGRTAAEPVKRLGAILQALLAESNAPGELRLIVSQATFELPSYASVDEFSRALQYFERPGRSEAIRAVHDRSLRSASKQSRALEPQTEPQMVVADAPPAAMVSLVPDSLTEFPSEGTGKQAGEDSRVLFAPMTGAPRAVLSRATREARAILARATGRARPVLVRTTWRLRHILARATATAHTRRLVAASVGGAVAVAVLLLAIARQGGTGQMAAGVSRTVREAKTTAAETLASGIAAIKERLGRSGPGALAAEASVDQRATKPPDKKGPARTPLADSRAPSVNPPGPLNLLQATFNLYSSQRATGDLAPVIILPQGANADEAFGGAPSRGAGSGPSAAGFSAVAPTEALTYTSSDEGVTPPVLWRPQLPSTLPPDLRPDQLGVLDLLINETGTVDSVKLRSPLNRFHDRMIVSAAKAWQFRPAFKNGQPVKVRHSVRITLPN